MFGRSAFRLSQSARSFSTSASVAQFPVWAVAVGAGAVTAALIENQVASASDVLHSPAYPWSHNGFFSSFDHPSMRRGFEVYRQVCSTCHSVKYLHYRQLIGETHSEVQAKALAESIMVKDGPNDMGEMFERPGRLSDPLPQPYPNEEYARYINGGALPPDLSLIVKARHGGADYIYALLTGYREPPHGVTLRQGLYYNPYFQGGAIAMPPPLNDGGVEYEDKTPATISQQAKDVTVFLNWVSEPEHDTRKLYGSAVVFGLFLTWLLSSYYKRFTWSIIKTRRITWVNTPSDVIRPRVPANQSQQLPK